MPVPERSPDRLPPMKVVQAALATTTEILARELAQPSAREPQWSSSEWRIARAAASLHGIAPLLARVLRWKGPEGWQDFLRDQFAHTAVRQARLLEFLGELDRAAREQGVPFIALKGQALHALGLYSPGERPMADLDLLTRADDAKALAVILRAMRFRQTAETWKHSVFEPEAAQTCAPFGEHGSNPLKVDLHTRLMEILPLRPVEIAGLMLPARPAGGLNPYASNGALMIHLLLHAGGAILSRTLRMIQLHDIALLSTRMSQADWTEVTQLEATERGLWWAYPALQMVQRYYGLIPRRVLDQAAGSCRWPLRVSARHRTVTDVSFSDLRRSALAGIEWSQSIAEVLQYAGQRAVLTARILARRRVASDAQLVPAESLKVYIERRERRTQWYALRPVRPAGLDAVRKALGCPS